MNYKIYLWREHLLIIWEYYPSKTLNTGARKELCFALQKTCIPFPILFSPNKVKTGTTGLFQPKTLTTTLSLSCSHAVILSRGSNFILCSTVEIPNSCSVSHYRVGWSDFHFFSILLSSVYIFMSSF